MTPYLNGDTKPERNGNTTKDPCSAPVLGETDRIEPIAIVGLSFEFPQDATSLDAFWELLMSKRNTATEFPKDRISLSAMYHPDRNRRGQVSVAHPEVDIVLLEIPDTSAERTFPPRRHCRLRCVFLLSFIL